MKVVDFWCAYCKNHSRLIEVHGHTVCAVCYRVIETCCDGGESE